ncbi:hypothetical protein QZH41_003596 [Actinostola sp. cb2023]|nr:hypothetical protein QZH41_003596 [Actinostola sp. cb2023]
MDNNVDREDGQRESLTGSYESGVDSGLERASGTEMDEQRKQNLAYQYLCHLEEAKVWMEACLKEDLPETTELEEYLRNGVHLAKLGNFFAPKVVPHRKIFDKELKHFQVNKIKTILVFDFQIPFCHLPVDEAALHAAVIAINEAIDHHNAPGTMKALKNPNAHLVDIDDDNGDEYQSLLYGAKDTKAKQALAKSPGSSKEIDIYDKYLTQAEVQGNISQVNDSIRRKKAEEALQRSVQQINKLLDSDDAPALLTALSEKSAKLSSVEDQNASWYLQMLREKRQVKQESTGDPNAQLSKDEIQEAVNAANEAAEAHRQMIVTVEAINKSLDKDNPEETHQLIQKNEAMLPKVFKRSAYLYHSGLKKEKDKKQGDLVHEDMVQTVTVLSATAAINAAIDKQNPDELMKTMHNSNAQLETVDDSLGGTYLEHFVSVKQEKGQDCGIGKDDLTPLELQICVDYVNTVVQEEHDLPFTPNSKTNELEPEEESNIPEENNVNSDEDYDTDLDDEPHTVHEDTSQGRGAYLTTCENLRLVPCSPFLRQLHKSDMDIKHYNLGPKGAEAIAVALMQNTKVLTLIIAHNDIQEEGAIYISKMLTENFFITELDISFNNLRSQGAYAVAEMMRQNAELMEINLSGNKFGEKDAEPIVEALKSNFTLKALNLSQNEFSEVGGQLLGPGIDVNVGLEYLNLSWNHIRCKGAIAVAFGVGQNCCLRTLDVSWNGFGDDGTKAMGEALTVNNTLTELDLSNNRITVIGASHLAKGLAQNKTLQTLRVGKNPISSQGAYDILSAVYGNPDSAMEELGFVDVPVNAEFEDLLEDVLDARPNLNVICGAAMKGKDRVKKLKNNVDVLNLLLEYIELRGLRMVDFFRQLDKDGSRKISRSEFMAGVKKAGIPMTRKQLQKLVNILDVNNDGEIDYVITALSIINKMIDEREPNETTQALQSVEAKLGGVDSANAQLYQEVLFASKTLKAQKTNNESAELWHDEIQACIDHSNKHADETIQLAQGLGSEGYYLNVQKCI